MSSPLPDIGNPLPDSPSDALTGSPGSPLPDISVGGRAKGSRGRGGLLGRDYSAKRPRAPLAPAERAQGHQALQVVRREPTPAPTPLRADQPARLRTPAGAPVERPREVPKTGAAESEREAVRGVLSKDTRHFHEGLGHSAQDQFNKLLRAHGDITRRESNDMLAAHFRALRERALRDAREARAPGPTARERARRGKQYEGIDATLDQIRGTPNEQP